MIKMHLVTAYHGLKPKDEPSREPAAMRRRMLLLGVPAAALLAGCASKPTSNGSHASADPTRRRPAGSADGGVVPINLGLSGELRDTLYARVMMVVNTPYTYGGNTPEGGFDCSGLIQWAVGGVTETRLPRTTAQWAQASNPVDGRGLMRGDFVFFNTMGRPYSHMGIFVGNGQFVHAPSTGGTVQRVRMDNVYFAKRFTEARSIFA